MRLEAIAGYAKLCGNFFIVGESPGIPAGVILNKELVCLQMLCEQMIDLPITETIVKLNEEYNKDLFELVNLVQPGYFKTKTAGLGDYYGIFKKEKLVAVAGERMKMNEFTELSSIVTHPLHTGMGYASQLIAFVTNEVLAQDKTAYLHVAEANSTAIKLYKKLGFIDRRKISFWNLINTTWQPG